VGVAYEHLSAVMELELYKLQSAEPN
jgi:hypothetical protein